MSNTRPPGPESLSRMLRPRSIAVFGGTAAIQLVRQCDRLGFEGEIWPVHPRKEEVEGRQVFRSVADLPSSPDASYIGVNRHLTIDIVRELAARGAGGAVCYATGFSEAGEEGAELAQQLLEASGDMPLIGPNCYGLLNFVDGAALWPDQQGARRVDSGVALISMSSNVAFNLSMQRRGLPLAYMMSLGNKLKFDLADAISTFAQEERVSTIGLYLEAITDPHAFEAAVLFARECGKPVVAVKCGRSEVAQRVVVSHTASLAGSDALVDALFKRIGVARVGSLEALVEALKVLHVMGPLPGGRMAAMSTSGGDLALLADGMMETPLTMPALPENAARALREVVHERVEAANPLDFQMFDWNDPDRLATIFQTLLSARFDAALCVLDYPRSDRCDYSEWLGAERGFINAVRHSATPGAVLSTFGDTLQEEVAERLLAEGIAPLAGIDSAVEGLAAAVKIGRAWAAAPMPPLQKTDDETPEHPARTLDEAESMTLLSDYGLGVPSLGVASNASEAVLVAETMGYPVVVKALGIDHKTEVGGVHLGLKDAQAVQGAVAQMQGLCDRFMVAEMIEGGVAELIVGVNRDPQFGPTLLIGLGGVLVELLRDTASLLLPVSEDQVREALLGLRGARLLQGYRGAPAIDLDAAIESVMAVSRFACEQAQNLLELDINPVILTVDGAIAADALIRIRQPEPTDGDTP